MEKEEMTRIPTSAHHGHAIKRLRLDRGLSQKELGDKINMAQQAVSHYEEEKKINEPLLERFAKALNVSSNLIKELEDEKPLTFYIENNTFSNFSDNSSAIVGNNNGTGVVINQQNPELNASILDEIRKISEEDRKYFKECLDLVRKEIALLDDKINRLKE